MTEGGTYRELIVGDVFGTLQDLDENSGNCAIVDYPWEFDTENGNGHYREFYPTEPISRFVDVIDQLARVLVDGAWLFVFADDEIYPDMRSMLEYADVWTRRQTCIWDIDCISMGAYHRVAHYPILTATLGKTDRELRDRGTVYTAQRCTGAVGPGHDRSTAKPVGLYRQILEPPVLQSGERLIEPFAGTAPGLTVCQERDLRYWGVDLDDEIIEKKLAEPEVTTLGGGQFD